MKGVAFVINQKLSEIAQMIASHAPQSIEHIKLVEDALQELQEEVGKAEDMQREEADLINRLYYANDENVKSAEEWRQYAFDLEDRLKMLEEKSNENKEETKELSEPGQCEEFAIEIAQVSSEGNEPIEDCPCQFLVLKREEESQAEESDSHIADYTVAELLNEEDSDILSIMSSI